MDLMKERRMGRLKIAFKLYSDEDFYGYFWKFKFLPCRAEMMFMNDHVILEGLSPLFDPVDVGAELPFYRLLCETSPGGHRRISVEREK
jgi:hypothetical protein